MSHRTQMKPFFTFYGGKWRQAGKYPAPACRHVIEPFAGSAGYSVRHVHPNVTLVDADEKVAGVWDYLIHVGEMEILALPEVETSVDDLPAWVTQEARWLIGFWLNKGSANPSKRPSAWMRSGHGPKSWWGAEIRQRIASQLRYIRDWKIIHGTYADLEPSRDSTWFVDPPYSGPAGRCYRKNAVDYAHLADWCKAREGQVIVCEGPGAEWLPFSFLGDFKASESKRGGKRSAEYIWYKAPLPPVDNKAPRT